MNNYTVTIHNTVTGKTSTFNSATYPNAVRRAKAVVNISQASNAVIASAASGKPIAYIEVVGDAAEIMDYTEAV